ncbi:hypothetical protein N0754_19275 [Pseudomonas aeruginosa]|nr:hypothetical protein [Pseudomonas aeruginosa]MCS9764378.1 hypothetical protein [Pseudomonas aeruginosa]MCS9822418.1 hypothetical protein [Pseudomonas aeruginosa]MCT0241135.1 hypothetical protein [Pseudomonas aeruginosa]MCT0529983.1 hypothetical protein [Pseudomonas aeruginosa]
MKKVTALALILVTQAGLCHAASEELLPLPTKTVSVKVPGKPKEDRVVDDRFLITYTSRLVEFEGSLPDASVKALAADGSGYEVLSRPSFSAGDNRPVWVTDQQEISIPKESVSGNTRTLSSVPVSLGIVIVVDPVVPDRSRPDTVLTRLYLNHTEMADNKDGGEPITASPHAADKLKVGDKQLITWSMKGHNYGLELQLTSITDNSKS